jgi:O-antigen ligase/tetratricopeptide (TPR) repeat protein
MEPSSRPGKNHYQGGDREGEGSREKTSRRSSRSGSERGRRPSGSRSDTKKTGERGKQGVIYPDFLLVGDETSGRVSRWFALLGRLFSFGLILVSPWWIASVGQTAQSVLFALALASLSMLWMSLATGKPGRQLFPLLCLPVIAGVGLLFLQTVPLPETVHPWLAPKQARMYQDYATPAPAELAGEDSGGDVPVRVTMDVDGTRRSLNLLVLSLISFLVAAYLFAPRNWLAAIPLVMTISGVAVSAYGIVLRLAGEQLLFGAIEIRPGTSPFGPFINQNNAAGYLLICLACSLILVVYAFNRRSGGDSRPRLIITHDYPIWHRIRLHFGLFLADLNAVKLASLLAVVIIAFGVVGTMSRGGIMAMIIAALSVIVFYAITRKSFAIFGVSAIVAVILLAALSLFGMSDAVMQRLNELSDTDIVNNEVRIKHWIQTSPAITDFSPMGSGAGSYPTVHRLYRVDSETRIFNYAENQLFQALVETGWIGLALLVMAILMLVRCVVFLNSDGVSVKTQSLCIGGIFLITSQFITSMFDFGHYVPANAVAMALVCGLIIGQAHSLGRRIRKNTAFRVSLPGWLIMLVLLLTFAGGLASGLSTWQYARTAAVTGKPAATDDYSTTTLAEVGQRIEALKQAVAEGPEGEAFRRLGELYVLRYRLTLFEKLRDRLPGGSRENDNRLKSAWQSTGLEQLHSLIQAAHRGNNPARVRSLCNDSLVRSNLLPAAWYLKQARSRSPLQPATHLLLGLVHCIGALPDPDLPHLARARQLAPANAVTFLLSGIMDLHADRIELACKNLRRTLQIAPEYYDTVIAVTLPMLSVERIAGDVLPDNVNMLFHFAFIHLTSRADEKLKKELTDRVKRIILEDNRDDTVSLAMLVEIDIWRGDLESASGTIRRLVKSDPNVLILRVKIANLFKERGEYEKALREINWIRGLGHDTPQVMSLHREILKLQEASVLK